jgi:FO synthase subunit 1
MLAIDRGGIDREDALVIAYSNLRELMLLASMHRDRSKGRVVTYSRKVFIPITNLCRDHCSYCTYREEPSSGKVIMLKPEHVIAIAEKGKRLGCTEALIMSGESPEQRYPEARAWLRGLGFSNIVEYVAYICDILLKRVNILPHTNIGNITYDEARMLKECNASLGLMLENISPRLSMKGMPHEHAPSKNPKVRLKSIEDAGRARVAFTTGLLIGIGESMDEVIDSLLAIKEMHERYKHIQEIIIQNFNPKPDTQMHSYPAPSREYMLRVVAIARLMMPYMNIQVPPNLNHDFYEFLHAGINDYGGVSPLTIDHVNPEAPWPSIDYMKSVTESNGFRLRARLPVYPEYISNEYISDAVMEVVDSLMDEHGLVKGL